ncbi:MAG: ATP-binding protein [Patescibacteria group bacterium]|jgi:signal transduction histidine kinase
MDLAQLRPIALFLAAFLQCIFAFLIWSKGKSKEAFYLGWVAFFSAISAFAWAGVFFFDNKLFWTKATWLTALAASSYVIFIYYFTGKTKFFKLKFIFWYGLSAAISIISLATPYIIYEVSNQYPFIGLATAGPLNQLARVLILPMLIIPFYYLISFYRKSIGAKRLQMKYFITGISVYFFGAFLFYGILPLFFPEKFFSYLDAPVYFSIVWLGLATYAIIKRKLFEIKVILTELLVALIGLILLAQIFLTQDMRARLVNITVFLLYIMIGYLLIRSTNKEVEKEERAEELADKLEELNLSLEKIVNKKTNELQIKVKELDQSKKALINILEDNTEARREMEEEENKTLAIIANFTDPIIVLDKDYKIGMINPAASRVFGLNSADLGRQVATDNKFSMSNFKPIIKTDYEIKPISEGGKDHNFISEEITLKDASLKEDAQGTTFKVITAKVLSLNNEPLGVMKIFYDTTREKAIDKMKSEFISIAAHQLRTPLSAIKWVIKMILDGDAGKLSIEQQELLNKGYLSNERIIRLVNDLLNVSRIEEGRFGFNFERVNFQEVLDTAISNVESLAVKSHQELTVEKPPKLPKVFLDKERMIMVLQNLLSNAIKYTPEYGKIKVIIEVDKQYFHVKIKDQGVGIPAEDQPKLFSKFFRAANVVKLETEGTGLGLFLVKNIIEKHDGQVSLKSEEGKGTEVSFFIPINKTANL